MKELDYKLDLATKLARKGRVSRRDFVQLAIAAGFTAAAANTMFTTPYAPSPRRAAICAWAWVTAPPPIHSIPPPIPIR